jgi:hypothetical protein
VGYPEGVRAALMLAWVDDETREVVIDVIEQLGTVRVVFAVPLKQFVGAVDFLCHEATRLSHGLAA